MDRNVIILVVLAVLVLLSAVQAVQLANVKQSISTGGFKAAGAPAAAGGGAAPTGLEDLQGMVGGC